ncbi:MAG: winged helix-turn-helix transcriptional regulator [Candidatus Helarchaeota archaeon]|nr:winged helix-turn-helix transcriptional regulator [Candidatus Helarchaeota archaeon]
MTKLPNNLQKLPQGEMTANDLNIFKPSEEMRDLKFLEELEKNPIVSQRELSHRFGIALGVTNACLRRMARKGWIRIRDLNPRRIGYYLTPKGMLEKTKLTIHLISFRVQNYSELKKVISNKFLEMQHDGRHRVVFYGVSDEMEVAYVTLQGVNLKLVGIVEDDEKFTPQFIFGYELERVSRINELKPDCVLITSLTDNEQKKWELERIYGPKSICIKDICL